MCFASIISWDSFDLNEIIQDDVFIKVIISFIPYLTEYFGVKFNFFFIFEKSTI